MPVTGHRRTHEDRRSMALCLIAKLHASSFSFRTFFFSIAWCFLCVWGFLLFCLFFLCVSFVHICLRIPVCALWPVSFLLCRRRHNSCHSTVKKKKNSQVNESTTTHTRHIKTAHRKENKKRCVLIFSGKSRQRFFFFEKCSQAVTWVFFSNCDLFLSSGETGTATTKEEPNKLCFLSVIRYIPLKLILFFFSSLLSSKQNGIPSSHLDFFFFSQQKQV